jgi:hypothetical protein
MENLKGTDHLEDLGIDGNIKTNIKEIRWEDMDLIQQVQK